MSGMLARLAALRARREKASVAGDGRHQVDPALAAAAAAAGKPTRGTWDTDYAERLRDVGDAADAECDLSDSDYDDGEVVVLPPPSLKLDPVAQREKWRREMRAHARGFVAGKCEPIVEVKEEAVTVGADVETVEIQGEIEDEDDLLGTDCDDDEEGRAEVEVDDDEKIHEKEDGDGCDGVNEVGNAVSVKISITTGDDGREGVEDMDEDESDAVPPDQGGNTNSAVFVSVLPKPLRNDVCDSEKATDACVSSPESSVLNSGDKSDSNSPSPSRTHAPLVLIADHRGPSTRPALVDDQAEDEEDGVGDLDRDRDSDCDEATEADALVADDGTPGALDSSAVAFHRKWEERDEADRMAAIVSGAQGMRDSRATGRPRNDDNAMDLSEMVQSGNVVATGGERARSECGSMGGVIGDGGESNGELMDMAKDETETYVEDMFRMNREESGFIDVDEEESNDDTPTKKSEDERRSKAAALWRARQKRSASSSGVFESVDLSRCEFLQDDQERRDHYRAQIERAQGINISRDNWSVDAGASSVGTSGALGIGGRNNSRAEGVPSAVGASQDSKFPSLQVAGKRAASSNGLLDPDVAPEWERRKLCLGRKEAHRRSGTSIGKWAFSAERSMGGRSIDDETGAAPRPNGRVGGGSVSVRRKRSRNPAPTAPSAPSVSAAKQARPKKKPKRSRQSLLDILGSRPQADS